MLTVGMIASQESIFSQSMVPTSNLIVSQCIGFGEHGRLRIFVWQACELLTTAAADFYRWGTSKQTAGFYRMLAKRLLPSINQLNRNERGDCRFIVAARFTTQTLHKVERN